MRLGRAIARERGPRWRSRRDFASAAGISTRTVDDLETGRRDNYLDTTLAAVELALGWQFGTCVRVVQGGRVVHEVDPDLARLLVLWRRLSRDARLMLVEVAERAVR